MSENNSDLLLAELHQLNQTNRQIAEYLKILVQPEIESRLSIIFGNKEELKAYELSDGNRSTREISSVTNLNKNVVSDLWKRWAEMGMVISMGNLKPYKAQYSLIDLALNVEKFVSSNKTREE